MYAPHVNLGIITITNWLYTPSAGFRAGFFTLSYMYSKARVITQPGLHQPDSRIDGLI